MLTYLNLDPELVSSDLAPEYQEYENKYITIPLKILITSLSLGIIGFTIYFFLDPERI